MSFPEVVPGSTYRSLLDVVTGTVVTGIVENIFSMIQVYLTNSHLFGMFGISKTGNETILRILRIIAEPPILLSTIFLTESAFVADAGTATVFMGVVLQNSLSGYLMQVLILRNQFIDFIRGMEQAQAGSVVLHPEFQS